jgi:ERCC4-type nuclease
VVGEGATVTKAKLPPPIVVVDSREQRPFTFDGGLIVEMLGGPWPTIVRGLPEGDYALDGAPERYIALERKSAQDLVGSVTHGRERFMREMDRLAAYRFPAVIVEASIEWVVEGFYHPARRMPAGVTPRSVLGSVLAIANDRRIPVWFVSSRVLAEYTAGWLLRRASDRLVAERDPAGTTIDAACDPHPADLGAACSSTWGRDGRCG